MSTFHLHINGRVQGVGFRPHVYRLARRLGLLGWINNGLDGVHIRLTGPPAVVETFRDDLLADPPPRAIITHWEMRPEVEEFFSDFQIVESHKEGKANLLLTPDLGICEDCRRDIREEGNHRYRYAFTTCTNCGPRYSIINALPYDRENTTMDAFCMCGVCYREFHDPGQRRHFSQTNSCPACAVHLLWQDNSGGLLTGDSEKAVGEAIWALHKGKILGVKGIGGYLLMADATQASAVARLRERKHRPAKPFALLYPNRETLEGDVWVSEREYEAYTSIESPIVLFRLRDNPASGLALAEIAPGLDTIGVMQPYTPLLDLLAEDFGKPLVATSGNFSGSPIFFEDEPAIQNLGPVVDFFLGNDRDIVVPQDDSVLRISERHAQPIFLRRSRGYAPSLLHSAFAGRMGTALAMGAMLKSTFALHTQENTYVSQYLGNSENFDVQQNYRRTLSHFFQLFEASPEVVIADLHPDYFTTQWGAELAREWGAEYRQVQHHRAHFAAVLAEHDLLRSKEPILGVIWDGTGYGEDGQIWGGEYFRFAGGKMERTAHLSYFDHLFGDKMAKEPRLTALFLAGDLAGAEEILRPKFSEREWSIYRAQLEKGSGLQTSSVGRLFDGVSSLLGICDWMSFEGEAAMYLEVRAKNYIRQHGVPKEGYPVTDGTDWRTLIQDILADVRVGTATGLIAARFHRSLVEMIRLEAERQEIKKLAFSGGVWQNALLADLVIEYLEEEYELFFHRQLSPNDECISFGQLADVYCLKSKV